MIRVLIGGLLGAAAGLYVANLINQALCPHGVFAGCRELSTGGVWAVVLACVAAGALIGRLIGTSR